MDVDVVGVQLTASSGAGVLERCSSSGSCASSNGAGGDACASLTQVDSISSQLSWTEALAYRLELSPQCLRHYSSAELHQLQEAELLCIDVPVEVGEEAAARMTTTLGRSQFQNASCGVCAQCSAQWSGLARSKP